MDVIFLSILALGIAMFVFCINFYKFVWPKSKKRAIVCVALTSVCTVILFLVTRTIFGNISGNFVLSIVLGLIFTIAIDIVAILIAWKHSKGFNEPLQDEVEEPEEEPAEEPVQYEQSTAGAQAPGHVYQEVQ